MGCLFCKIAKGEIPSHKVYEDEFVIAINDIAPQAPVHVLIIPKEHIMSSAREAKDDNSVIIAHIFVVAARIAQNLGLDSGYRMVTNVGEDAGQTVNPLHFHLLGGKTLGPNA